MSKKKKIIILLAILSCILITFVGEQSFSKYMAEIRENGTADIATWEFKVNGKTDEAQNIELLSLYDINQVGPAEEKTIAPGSKGSFAIVIDCTNAEVKVGYTIRFENETTKPTNLKFKYQDHTCNNLSELEEFLSGYINPTDEDKKRTFTIEWEWPFETGNTPEEKAKNDKIDTRDSQNITNYSFDAVVTGTQVM